MEQEGDGESRYASTGAPSSTLAAEGPTGLLGVATFGGLRAYFQRIDPHGLGDVLELGRTEIADCETEPAFDVAVGVLGQTDRTGLCDPLEPRGDVDAVAHEVAVALLDDIAEMNANPKLDALLGRHRHAVALDHRCLDFDRAAYSADHAAMNSMIEPSPVRLTTWPWCTEMIGSIRSLRSVRSQRQVRFLVGAGYTGDIVMTSAVTRIAASFRVSLIAPRSGT